MPEISRTYISSRQSYSVAEQGNSCDAAAAIVIQALVCPLLWQMELSKLRKACESLLLEAAIAAIMIQSLVRSWRCQIELQRKTVLAQDLDQSKNAVAANIIQSFASSLAYQREVCGHARSCAR